MNIFNRITKGFTVTFIYQLYLTNRYLMKLQPGFDLEFHVPLASRASEVVTQLALPAKYWPDFYFRKRHAKMQNILDFCVSG